MLPPGHLAEEAAQSKVQEVAGLPLAHASVGRRCSPLLVFAGSMGAIAPDTTIRADDYTYRTTGADEWLGTVGGDLWLADCRRDCECIDGWPMSVEENAAVEAAYRELCGEPGPCAWCLNTSCKENYADYHAECRSGRCKGIAYDLIEPAAAGRP